MALWPPRDACGAGRVCVVAALTDVPAMLYQTLAVPSGHPWRGGEAFPAFVQTLRDLVPRLFTSAAVIGAYGLFRLWQGGSLDVRRWARDNPWLVPVFVGVFLVPTSILGRMKVGGGMGALVYAVYFLFLGALLAIVHAAKENPRLGRVPANRVATVFVLLALVLVVAEAARRSADCRQSSMISLTMPRHPDSRSFVPTPVRCIFPTTRL